MRILFHDNLGWDYEPTTPLTRPLGGSQSTLCYLAAALAARGHEVALANYVTRPGTYAGVECRGKEAMRADYFNRFDIVISISAMGRALRDGGVRAPMLLWSHHDIGEPLVAPLKDAGERACWQGFALLSTWQANRYVSAFAIEPSRITIKRNAIAPAVARRVARGRYWFEEDRAPLLVYTSTPYRGLEILLLAFPAIRQQVPGCRLRVHSGMSLYQEKPEQDEYRLLYALAAAIDGAEYAGPIGQEALAESLGEADILAYPSTFAETSCISAMEAMASGCLVVTTALGALPEALAGFGQLHAPSSAQPTPVELADGYGRAMVAAIRGAAADPAGARARLDAQSAHARRHYEWSGRAAEWEAMLQATLPRL